jgi:transglutaminase-like putative cysteine protease
VEVVITVLIRKGSSKEEVYPVPFHAIVPSVPMNPLLERFILWVWRRFQPEEGWLAVVLLLAAVACLSGGVIAAERVPEVWVVGWTAMWGLVLAMVLAKRPLPWATAWLFIVEYGLVTTTIYLARLWPPLATLLGGWGPTSEHIRLNLALFADRTAGWWQAVAGGGESEETIVFAFGLGGLAWLLAAYAGWSTFRQRRPLAGLTIVGLALALNSYFGDAPIWLAAIFVALAALIAAALHYANLEREWRDKGVDYSQEIRLDLLLAGGAVSLLLLATAFTVPAINPRAIVRAVFERPAVQQVEETLGRVFAGVQPPRQGPLDESSGGSGRGVLPRSYLLGNPPELSETVAMRAIVTVEGVVERPEARLHWRGISYDVYTGRGWALSSERQETVAAGAPIPWPSLPTESQVTARQAVFWVLDQRVTRYTIGAPLAFEQDVVTLWRGVEDLSRVQGTVQVYTATSQLVAASPAELRVAEPAGIPLAVQARYTQLPEEMPARVRQLAQEVAGAAPTAYDQALALQSFLRQYPYSLDVELPPADLDPVEFFLFELQRGYCDYYASAMVVMARSLGLPARVAAGFLAQPPDENGVQTIYQIHAHSWPEIYFAGYGWVEFEPTPATSSGEQANSLPATTPEVMGLATPPPIPEATVRRPFPWWSLLLLLLLPLGWWVVRQRQRRPVIQDRILWAYDQLQHQARHLGQRTPASQTPAEFQAALLARLDGVLTQKPSRVSGRLARLHAEIRPEAERLINLFIARQYGRVRPMAQAAILSWRRLRGRLWLLRILKKISG